MKKIAVIIAAVMMLSMILLAPANAATFPNLPATQVTLTLTVGPTKWPGTVALSGVPAGYDVTNSPPAYTAWCAQFDQGIEPAPTTYSATLISSLGISHTWNKINYLLNHNTGEDLDEQVAIWLLLGTTPADIAVRYPGQPSVDANAMYADANTRGSFVPSPGELVAVICQTTNVDVQDLIIELEVPEVPGRGKVTGGGQCIVGDNKKIPSGSFGFNAMWFSRDPSPKGEINYVDHITGMHVHAHDLTYLEVWWDLPGNKPWPLMKAKFGGPCTVDGEDGHLVDVYVEDRGEPGKNDKFYIKLDGVYLGGSLVDPILAGNIQIHKPPK